jgi:hypothetical protein
MARWGFFQVFQAKDFFVLFENETKVVVKRRDEF